MDRLYISADIEGVCGIADWKETEIGEAQGAYFRTQMTREAAAACEAAVAAGVSDILLKDAHGSGRSIDPSALPRQTRLMRAWTRDPYSMMAGLDATFGGACYIGYHSAAGTDGNPWAYRASFYPGVRRNGANGITLTARSWLDVISFIHFAL